MKLEEIEVGKAVTYYGVILEDGTKLHPFETVIRSKPWQLGDEIVCKVVGKPGGVSIKHLEEKNNS